MVCRSTAQGEGVEGGGYSGDEPMIHSSERALPPDTCCPCVHRPSIPSKWHGCDAQGIAPAVAAATPILRYRDNFLVLCRQPPKPGALPTDLMAVQGLLQKEKTASLCCPFLSVNSGWTLLHVSQVAFEYPSKQACVGQGALCCRPGGAPHNLLVEHAMLWRTANTCLCRKVPLCFSSFVLHHCSPCTATTTETSTRRSTDREGKNTSLILITLPRPTQGTHSDSWEPRCQKKGLVLTPKQSTFANATFWGWVKSRSVTVRHGSDRRRTIWQKPPFGGSM